MSVKGLLRGVKKGDQCPMASFLKLPGTINKQAMKDYRAALVTARVNYYPICVYLTALSEYHDIWLN